MNEKLEKAKAGVKLFLVSPEQLSNAENAVKAEYLYFLTLYLEEKRTIESEEEQMALVNYLAPEFGKESFERKIDSALESIQNCIRRLERLAYGIREDN
jgi:hypothetical protein